MPIKETSDLLQIDSGSSSYKTYVKEQIAHISKGLTKVMFGDFNTVVRSASNDEDFGYLCVMVNVAINAARNAQKDLLATNKNLSDEISRRTAALEEVERSEALFRIMFDRSPLAKALISLDGKLLDANAAFLKTFRARRKDLSKLTVTSLSHPAEMDRTFQIMKKLTSGKAESISMEKRCVRSDGVVRDCRVNAVLLRDAEKRPWRVLATYDDITDRKQTQRALVVSEQQFRSSFELAPLGMALGTTDGKILDANASLCRMFGYTKSEMIRLGMAAVTDPQDQAKMMEAMQKVVRGEQETVTIFTRHLGKGGRKIWCRISMSKLLGSKNADTVIGTLEDVTEAKEQEKELRRSRSMVAAAEENERKRIARELHDGVNQVLGSIRFRMKGMAGLGIITDEVGDEIGGLLERAITEVRRISKDLRPETLDELGLASALRELVRNFDKSFGIAVKLSLGRKRLPIARNVELTIYRIVQELLSNAGRHSGATRVSIVLSLKGENAVCVVEDNGKGFSSPGAKGKRGLGMTHILERCSNMGGKVDFSPREGGGTTVRITLPVELDHETHDDPRKTKT